VRRVNGAEPDISVAVFIDSLGQGGAEQSLMAVLPGMRAHGIVPELWLLRSIAADHEQSMRDAGIDVRVLDGGSNPVGIARAVHRMLRAGRPDLLHVTLFEPIVGGALGAIGTGVPVLATQASTPPETGRTAAADASGSRWKIRVAVELEAFVCRHFVTRVHAVSPGVRDLVAKAYRIPPERISVAERGRDAARFHPVEPSERLAERIALGVGPDEEVLVALGRHEPSKGFDDLIAAFALVVRARPRTRLLIAGREGTLTAHLTAAIAAAGLEDRVTLLGNRPNPERILAAADVFVLSSRREGTSGATIEAMATALPVVATELPGLDGIIDDGVQALTVPVGQPKQMADAIVAVLEDPDLRARLAREGLATFTSRFTLDRSIDALSELYRSVAASTKRAR